MVPFEEMKLRMLNGSHSFLAYLGYLAGYQHINDCMQDDNFVAGRRSGRKRERNWSPTWCLSKR
ncbi:hypothetical protein BCR59_28165 [Klebsiella pneumoniae]|nr:hypothetical protein BCR59_28165 [Klebsiella pneumoniae]